MKKTNTLLSTCSTIMDLFIFQNDISETGDKYKNKNVRQSLALRYKHNKYSQ